MSSPVLEKATLKNSCVLLYNVSWEQLEQLDVTLEGTGAHLTYLDGILEIMSPLTDEHEVPKKTIAMLLEEYMKVKQIRFYAQGSGTLGKREDGTRSEPDESYHLGTKKPVPDLVVEITATSSGINKLEIYKRLRIPEVWFWEDGLLSVYCLQGEEYQKVTKSTLLPDLNLELLVQYSRMADQYDALNEFSQMIREK